MKENLAVLISSCDKFSDLWREHVRLYHENWEGTPIRTFLVTDKETDVSLDGIEIIVAPAEYAFPQRIRYALQYIEADYVLLTLDDYFTIRTIKYDSLMYLVGRAKTEKIDYLMLYDRRKDKPRKFSSLDVLEKIDLHQKYAITLYPAIWHKDFLSKAAKENLSPWLFEVSLTKTAREASANCYFSPAGTFRILDVVRKGKVLHKAARYFQRHGICIGTRPKISRFTEIKLAVMDWISWHAPKRFLRFIKRIGRKLGMNFYSED